MFELPHHRRTSYVFSSSAVYAPKSACSKNENNKAREITAFDYRRPAQRPRGLRLKSAAARLLGLRFRIPLGAWMSVSFECGVSSGTGLCEGPIPRPEESYRVYICVCVWMCVRLCVRACVWHWIIRCNNKPLPLQWGGRRSQTKTRRK